MDMDLSLNDDNLQNIQNMSSIKEISMENIVENEQAEQRHSDLDNEFHKFRDRIASLIDEPAKIN